MTSSDPKSTITPIRVLYIVGSGRSGSTIIANVLDQIPGTVSPGELYYLWDRGLIGNDRCGCGKPLRSCELWSTLIADTLESNEDPSVMVHRRNATVRTRHLVRVFLGRKNDQLRAFLDPTARVYRALSDRTNSTVIVDSSKVPVYGLALAKHPAFDVRFLHLVRDPRAVAYSWQRKKDSLAGNTKRLMTQHSATKSSLMWIGWNGIAQLLWGRSRRYLRIRYEDFVAAPQETCIKILRHAGQPNPDLSVFTATTTVHLEPSHSVSGNPARFSTGNVSITSDSEWTEKLARNSRIVTVALTWPLLLWYRYWGRS